MHQIVARDVLHASLIAVTSAAVAGAVVHHVAAITTHVPAECAGAAVHVDAKHVFALDAADAAAQVLLPVVLIQQQQGL